MNKTDKEFLYRSLNALRNIPAQGNAMSSRGAVEYANEIKTALAQYAFILYALEENDYGDAQNKLAILEAYSLKCKLESK